MRLLRTLIMGAMMVLPGLFLALIIWYIAGKPETEPLESIICNLIPLTSVGLGLFFGWKTGGEYAN
ncbi:MAG: hypothetical protein HN794_03220 [Euryarchaeota archaeon]|jgi:hypothetical protein|nr:hypothetical protein [Euryarchaeota archaeon]MBT4924796.1 hypothetical protein [Euryarchaeota archaeon]MBT5735477.1 hypothetical protein [Euryarchaeota archaeon]MBT7460036.1 hypothetical protein [Euryarchaeota archaeon]MDG1551414.1 hypothetical protein [Candidatus Poseidoniaceae archaeon]